jgi:hypothetical protein
MSQYVSQNQHGCGNIETVSTSVACGISSVKILGCYVSVLIWSSSLSSGLLVPVLNIDGSVLEMDWDCIASYLRLLSRTALRNRAFWEHVTRPLTQTHFLMLFEILLQRTALWFEVNVQLKILLRVGWYAWRKWRVQVRMIGFISTSVTITLLITIITALSLIYTMLRTHCNLNSLLL